MAFADTQPALGGPLHGSAAAAAPPGALGDSFAEPAPRGSAAGEAGMDAAAAAALADPVVREVRLAWQGVVFVGWCRQGSGWQGSSQCRRPAQPPGPSPDPPPTPPCNDPPLAAPTDPPHCTLSLSQPL